MPSIRKFLTGRDRLGKGSEETAQQTVTASDPKSKEPSAFEATSAAFPKQPGRLGISILAEAENAEVEYAITIIHGVHGSTDGPQV
jgi:hypothetical protein